MNWRDSHPRITAVGAIIMLILAVGSGLSGIWSLFSNDPLIPVISNTIMAIPKWQKYLLVGMSLCLIVIAISVLAIIFHRTKTRIAEQVTPYNRDKGIAMRESIVNNTQPFRLVPKRKVKRIIQRKEVINGKTKYTEEIELDP